jgi:hypothetical protein
MDVTRSQGTVRLELQAAEAELLHLTLKRATFEDTPPERQKEIVDFAYRLLRALEPEVGGR